MLKIKNRNHYDIIYQCLMHCKKYENSDNFPTTKTKFYTVLGGNSKILKDIFADILVNCKLIEVNPLVNHHKDVYRVTGRGQEYIECYQNMMELLGRDRYSNE